LDSNSQGAKNAKEVESPKQVQFAFCILQSAFALWFY
jgi:hypothetical protein